LNVSTRRWGDEICEELVIHIADYIFSIGLVDEV